MRQFKALLVAVLLGGVIPVAHASDWDGGKAHLGLLFSHPAGSPKATLDGDHVKLDMDDDAGFYGDFELNLKHNLGLKFGVSSDSYDIKVKGEGDLTNLGDRTYSANLLYHFGPANKTSFYVGGGFAFVNYDNLNIHEQFQPFFGKQNRINVRSDKTWDVEGGIDIFFHDDARWGLNVQARYVKTTAEEHHTNPGGARSPADLNIEVNPASLGVAATYRW